MHFSNISYCRNCGHVENYHNLNTDNIFQCFICILKMRNPRCYEFVPSDNLRYLELIYDKQNGIKI